MSQAVDIYSMLNKAQNEYKQQQSSVAAFFQLASTNNNGGAATYNNGHNRSMPVPIKSLSSLEQIERQIRTSPPSYQQNNNQFLHTEEQKNVANSPLAQFFNSNNLAHMPQRPLHEVLAPKDKLNDHKISAPPGFAVKSQQQQQQPQRNILASKEPKLITPVMFAPSSTTEKKTAAAEPLTKNQLLQALNYLIQNDEEFVIKIHEAYVKSFNNLAS